MAAPTAEPFRPHSATDVELADWCAVFADGQQVLSGSRPPRLPERLRAEEAPPPRWAARAAGRIAAVAELRLQPSGTGFLRLFTAPAARRRGLGTALLAAADRHGPDRVQATVLAGPPGEPFARTVPGLQVLLRLALMEQRIDARCVAECRALAAAPLPGYRIVHWIGAAPEDLAPSLGHVLGHVLDAPGAELQLAPRNRDTGAVRGWERNLTADGRRLLVCAAVDASTGEAVAATAAAVDPDGPVADQEDTAVAPAHRGRGLARRIKAEQVLRLAALFPRAVRAASTVNRANAPMLAVNRAVGYRTVHERLLVEAAGGGGLSAPRR